jgi:hypothetical protein
MFMVDKRGMFVSFAIGLRIFNGK